MAKNINLFVNTGNEETNQKFEVVQGKATRVKAVKGARYQLQDPANKDVAPEIVRSKRVNKLPCRLEHSSNKSIELPQLFPQQRPM